MVSDFIYLYVCLSHALSLSFWIFVFVCLFHSGRLFVCFLRRQRMKMWGWLRGEVEEDLGEDERGKTRNRIYYR